MAIRPYQPDNALASDVQSAHSLKGLLRSNKEAGVKEAAQQFEALFLQIMLKTMRETTAQDGLMDSDASRFFTGMLDEQLAKNVSRQGGLGLAKMLEEQLSRRMNSADDTTEENMMFNMGQWLSAPFIVLGIIMLAISCRQKKPVKPLEHVHQKPASKPHPQPVKIVAANQRQQSSVKPKKKKK
jgi:Rod binding domain-containing protein